MTALEARSKLISLSNGLSNPWDVRENLFPAAATNKDRLRFLLHYAVLAPSIHNSQPWLFRLSSSEVLLIADRSRALPVVDPDDRFLTMSCGAALLNLRVALQWFDFDTKVRTFPSLTEPDILASVRIQDRTPLPDDISALFRAITRRRTVRKIFEERPVDDEFIAQLREEAELEGATVSVSSRPHERREIASIVVDADRKQRENKSFRRELASWIHPNRTRSRDGLPRSRTAYQQALSGAEPLKIRTFDRGDGQAATEQDIVAGSPAVGVLTTKADRPGDWLTAGQAMERVLLRGTALGLAFSFLNQPIEQSSFRKRVADVFEEQGRPQLVFRIGYARRTRPSPRRSLSEVLVHPGYNP